MAAKRAASECDGKVRFPSVNGQAGQAFGAGERLLEARYLDDVDADADDHAIASRTTSASQPAISSANAVCRASTITRMTGSVPLGRSSTRPASPSLAFAAAAASATAGSAMAEVLVAPDVQQHLRVPGHQLRCGGDRDARAVNRRQQVQAGQHAIAGGGVVKLDDVPGLLAAKRVAAVAHRRVDVLVADRGLDHGDARVAHGVVKAEIGHHGDHHGVARELSGSLDVRGQHGEDLVSVERLALAVHGQAPVGVAVEREACVGAVLDDFRRRVSGEWSRSRR